jgi:endonuclease YncB( thermonuclease family)
VYCIIITPEGRELNELFVENGLARIYGTRTTLYDGRDSRKYFARLAELETQAKKAKRRVAVWEVTANPFPRREGVRRMRSRRP